MAFEIHFWSKILNYSMECAMQVWDRAFQIYWFRATVYKPLIHCNIPLPQKVFHADIDLSFRNFLAGLHRGVIRAVLKAPARGQQPHLWLSLRSDLISGLVTRHTGNNFHLMIHEPSTDGTPDPAVELKSVKIELLAQTLGSTTSVLLKIAQVICQIQCIGL
eukprot:1139288-Pelagomonas_calceolata.AAC.3